MAEKEEAKGEAPEGSPPDAAAAGGANESLGQKLKHTPMWVWITIAIALGTLIVGYLAYQHSLTNQATGAPGTTPTPGSTLPAGSTQPGGGGNYATQQEFQNLQQEIQNLQNSWHGGHGGGSGGKHRKHG